MLSIYLLSGLNWLNQSSRNNIIIYSYIGLLSILNIYLFEQIEIILGPMLINQERLLLLIIILFFIIQLKSNYLILWLIFSIEILLFSNDLLILLISIELLNFSIYLIIYNKGKVLTSLLKYYFLSLLNSTIFLLGILFIYISNGNLLFPDTISLGYNLILLGLLFKINIIPLHNWALDLYIKLDLEKLRILLILPKLIIFLLIIRITITDSLFIYLCGLISLIGGSIGLFYQTNLKKFIIYSSISNTGYFLILLGIDKILVIITILIYFLTMINILNLLPSNINKINDLKLSSMKALLLTINLLSLGGFPPLLGFYSKILLLSALGSDILILLIILIISLLNMYNYLQIITQILKTSDITIPYLKWGSIPLTGFLFIIILI